MFTKWFWIALAAYIIVSVLEKIVGGRNNGRRNNADPDGRDGNGNDSGSRDTDTGNGNGDDTRNDN